MYEGRADGLGRVLSPNDSDAQDAGQVERLPLAPLKEQIQGLTARIVEYKNCPSFVTSERLWLGCPCRIGVRLRASIRARAAGDPEAKAVRRLALHQDRRWVAVLPAAVKSEVRACPQELQHVPRRLGHGEHPRRHGGTTPESSSPQAARATSTPMPP